ncbi:MAG: site-2 protease family protein [Armatimonadetes bacterium]|nr:site-2 protease family protein [Armatimonadota bacterium]
MDIESLFIIVPIVLLSIAIHEYAHAKLADAAGDPTPGFYGRVTMNPLKHLDPFGTLFIIMSSLAGVGFGWGKPVPMDPRKMRNPRWDHFWAVIGGPLSNLIQAIVYAILLRVVMIAMPGQMSILLLVFAYGILINISLFLFNLLPLGPLDGMWIAGTFMNEQNRLKWTRWNLTYGQALFIFMILPVIDGRSMVSVVIGPLRNYLQNILL